MIYTVLYRGLLENCNFNCWYCPFASKYAFSEELENDRQSLNRFVKWIDDHNHTFKIFFTPKGEALSYGWYKNSFLQLSHHKKIKRVVIQTNLSCNTDWLSRCNPDKSAFWLTYHPESISKNRFYEQCKVLYKLKIPFSVGVVGVKENFKKIIQMRNLLPDDIYLWVNAYKRIENYYTNDEIDFLESIDPLFSLNQKFHISFGKSCDTGHTVFSVDGYGNIRRCHFSDTILGNIASHTLDVVSQPAPCKNQTCHCHIGYTHLNELNLKHYFGNGILERIPIEYQKIYT